MKSCIKSLCVLFLLVLLTHHVSAQVLDVRITNVHNKKGLIRVAIFDCQSNFKKEKTCWDTCFYKKAFDKNEFRVKIPIHSGRFALSVLDDENCSGKMEYNFLGIPLKGFGFSDYYLKGLCRPAFDDFCFKIAKKEIKPILVRMKYF